MDQRKLEKIVIGIIDKAINLKIKSNVAFDFEQLEILAGLNEYCVNQVLNDTEVLRDPRKIPYKASQELHASLVAICLAQSLTNSNRKTRENKEFFSDNITINIQESGVKFISFGKINPTNVQDAIYIEIVEDWKIYRDKEGLGIKSLVDEKTKLIGLDNYQRGGDPLYEFARFHRKYTEKEHKKEEKARENAQEAFRNAMAQTLATEVTRQQLIEGKNPMELLELLFSPQTNRNQIKQISKESKEIDPKVQQSILLMLEHNQEPRQK